MKSVHASTRTLLLIALGVLLVVLILPSLRLRADEATSPGYTLDWWTVDGGGQTGGDGSGYDLQGTIAQPDAALWQGGSYTLAGGFWSGPSAGPLHHLYLPLVLR